MLGDDAPADEMLLDDPLEHRRVASPIPCAFRVDDGDRTSAADPETVGLRAQDAALLGEPEFRETSLEVLPGLEAARLLAAFRRGLVTAEHGFLWS